MQKHTLKNNTVTVDGHHAVHGGAALIVWLLGQGLKVTVAGMRPGDTTTHLQRRVDEQLKRMAPDGRSYSDAVARLTWSRRAPSGAVNAYDMFLTGWRKRCVAVTGRVGKSTTVLWAAHLVGDAVAAGYSPEKPPVSVIGSRARVAILEADGGFKSDTPRLSVVSTDAADTVLSDPLMNADACAATWGAHNVPNIATAVHIARSVGVPAATIARRLASLPQPPHRQEVVHRDAKLTVVNDTLAVNPDAGIAAVRRWGGPTTILVTGGESASEYHLWADEVSARIRPTNVIAMPGSATRAMRLALRRKGFVVPGQDTLEGALTAALARAETYVSATILVSPAAVHPEGSDLGQRLNAFVRRELS